MRDQAESIPAETEKWRPEEVLSWAFATYGKDVAIASGFGIEGMVLARSGFAGASGLSSVHAGYRIPVS